MNPWRRVAALRRTCNDLAATDADRHTALSCVSGDIFRSVGWVTRVAVLCHQFKFYFQRRKFAGISPLLHRLCIASQYSAYVFASMGRIKLRKLILGQAGACSSIIGMLRLHSASKSVLYAAVTALGYLMVDCRENVARVSDAGGCAVLSSLDIDINGFHSGLTPFVKSKHLLIERGMSTFSSACFVVCLLLYPLRLVSLVTKHLHRTPQKFLQQFAHPCAAWNLNCFLFCSFLYRHCFFQNSIFDATTPTILRQSWQRCKQTRSILMSISERVINLRHLQSCAVTWREKSRSEPMRVK